MASLEDAPRSTALGRVEYLNQLIRIDIPLLSSEIARETRQKEKKAAAARFKTFIQEELIGYMDQDKEKGREFDLVDDVLMLKRIQEVRCALCHIGMKFDRRHTGDILQRTDRVILLN
ncbi:hypothetical protein GLOIN_2v1845703 [Rhizophagus clarus]|uniref:Uncharacterized protein n=1 Tax=Rhizophagus clarus TaxID=94130 RepID=A0A8H3LKV5_9GLOM|nr:hypothetical protein GLOIN_2v1845703 [Rhizophagus clarus]